MSTQSTLRSAFCIFHSMIQWSGPKRVRIGLEANSGNCANVSAAVVRIASRPSAAGPAPWVQKRVSSVWSAAIASGSWLFQASE